MAILLVASCHDLTHTGMGDPLKDRVGIIWAGDPPKERDFILVLFIVRYFLNYCK